MTTAPRTSLAAAALLTIATATVLTSSPAANGGTISTHKAPGVQTWISCISSKLCVAAGNTSKSKADVVTISGGTAHKTSVVRKSDRFNAISCATKGCVALASLGNGDTLVVPVDKHGKPGQSHDEKTPFGVELSAISCTRLTACTVAGGNIFSTPHEVITGTWNGKKLSLHKVNAPKGMASVGVSELSCIGTTCTAVGTASTIGFTVPITHGKPGKLTVHKGDDLTGISCRTTTICYVAGSSDTGFVATATNGKFTSMATFVPFPNAITCAGKSCFVGGQQTPPTAVSQGFYGSLVELYDGKVINTTEITQSQGYTSIATPKAGRFVAVGEGANGLDTTVVTAN